MSVDVTGGGSGFAALSSLRVHTQDAPFARNLALGKIVIGRVLRQYDDNRYLMSFSGEEKIVDSAVPLRTNEIVHGKVIAIGDRVELERIAVPREVGGAANDAGVGPGKGVGRNAGLVDELFQRYRGDLGDADRQVLLRQLKSVALPDAMALSGLTLNKLGLEQLPTLLQALYPLLAGDRREAGLFAADGMLDWSGPGSMQQLSPAAVGALADAVAAQLDRPHREDRHRDADPSAAPANLTAEDATSTVAWSPGGQSNERGTRHDGAPFDTAWQLLNTQTQGSVSQRTGTLPIWLGDQLVEVDVALFEQQQGTGDSEATRHRHVVFLLKTARLGNVQIVARTAGDRLRLQVITDSVAATETVAAHLQALRAALAAEGWQPDEISYATGADLSSKSVSRAVVEHIVSHDSVSLLG